MSADFPLDAKIISSVIRLTAEVLAVGECLGKFRSHTDVEMSAELNFHFSGFHRIVNPLLDATRVQSVHDIAEPLLVNMDPVTRIGQVLEHPRLVLRIFQEILDC